MSKYIGKYSTEGALADALFNGELSKPYVALVGNSLNYNEYGTSQSLTCSGQTTAQVKPMDEEAVLDVYGPSEWTLECATGTFNDTGLHTYAGSAKENVVLHFDVNTGDTTVNHTVTLTSTEGVASLTLTQESIDLLSTPLSFKILSDGTFGVTGYQYAWPFNATLNGNEVVNNTYTFTLDVKKGDIVTLTGKQPGSNFNKNVFGSASFNVYGNIMSIVSASTEVFPTLTVLNQPISSFFKETNVVSAKYLKLPATTLAQSCYLYMFDGCTLLTTAPALPATALKYYCYQYMFRGCTSLTTAPALPATSLAVECYQYMFSGCTSLNNVTCLATSVPSGTTTNWLSNVSATGTFTKAAGLTWPTGESGIPSGWEVVEV